MKTFATVADLQARLTNEPPERPLWFEFDNGRSAWKDARLDEAEAALKALALRIGAVEGRQDGFRVAMDDTRRRLDGHTVRLSRLENALGEAAETLRAATI